MSTRRDSHRRGCERLGRYLDELGAVPFDGERAPDELREHAESCAACAARLADYGAATEAGRLSPAVPLPSFHRIVGAVDERARSRARRRAAWTWGGAALAPAAALALLLFLSEPHTGPPRSPAPRPTAPAVVAEVSGVVSWDAGDGWGQLVETAPLPGGGTLETGLDGHARVIEAGVAAVDVSAHTRVRVERWRGGSVSLELEQGRLSAAVEPRHGNQRFEIVTPVARVVVVGTEFTTHHDPVHGTTVETSSGVVRVLPLDDRPEVVVRAGERAVVPVTALAEHGAPAPTDPPAAEETPATDLSGEEPATELTATPAPLPEPARPEPTDSATGTEQPTSAALNSGVSSRGLRAETPARRRTRPAAAPAGVTSGATMGAPLGPAGEPEPAPPETPDAPAEKPDPIAAARALLDGGDETAAIAVLEADGAQTRGGPRALALLGDAYRVAGRATDAVRAYEKALAADPTRDRGALVLDLTELLVAAGETGAAASHWRRYLEDHPDGRAAATVRWRLARHWRREGDGERAAALLEELLARAPNGPRAAQALEAVGQRDLAAGRLARAAERFESFRDARSRRVAETALVGLLHARRAQGRSDAVEALAVEYRRRFPDGRRQAEVERLLEQ